MSDYHFATRDFGLSDEGVHLLRNGFNYKTYKYSDILVAFIEKGKEIKNWMIVLILGVAMTLFAIFYSLEMFWGYQ